MPLRVYNRSARKPPTLLDHGLAHPFEIVIAVFGCFIGLCLTIAQMLDIFGLGHHWFVVNPELEMIDDHLALAYGLALTVGSVFMLNGLLDDKDDLMIGWARERMGLLIATGGWSSIAFTIVTLQHNRVFAWGLSLSVAVGCMVRFAATRIEERRTRRAKEGA